MLRLSKHMRQPTAGTPSAPPSEYSLAISPPPATKILSPENPLGHVSLDSGVGAQEHGEDLLPGPQLQRLHDCGRGKLYVLAIV